MGCGSSVMRDVSEASNKISKAIEEGVNEAIEELSNPEENNVEEVEEEEEEEEEKEEKKEKKEKKHKEEGHRKEEKEEKKEEKREVERKEYPHPHEHPLQFCEKITDPNYPNGQFNCNGCRRDLYGKVYHCPTCNYDNCPACHAKLTGEPPVSSSHPHSHPLKFYHELTAPGYNGEYTCDNCSQSFSGPAYHCDTCNYDNCTACYQDLTGEVARSPSLPAMPSMAPVPHAPAPVPQEPAPVPKAAPKEPAPVPASSSAAPSHPHPHPLKFYSTSPYASGKYRCDNCKTRDLSTDCYHCDPCKYDNCRDCFVKLGGNVETVQTVTKVTPSGKIPTKFSSLDEVNKKIKEEVAKIVADCNAKKEKYLDQEFTPTTLSLWRDPFNPPPDSEIMHPRNWRRLTTMVPAGQTPILWGQTGPTPSDIVQGGIGTCFLLSALGVLAGSRPDTIQNLFVAYDISAGVYGIRFWKDGRWTYVIIDDYVPTTLTTQTKRVVPAYAYCSSDAMLWVPLVEKAYAKLHQCYENIDGGFSNCAMMDLTGGYSMAVQLPDPLSSPVFSVNKYKENDATYYLGFVNGLLTGGGWRGPYQEYVFKGTYTIDGSVKFTSYPVKSKMNDPIMYLVNYTGKVDPTTKIISGTFLEDREAGLQNNSGIKYEVTHSGPAKAVAFKWEPQFFDERAQKKPDVFDGLYKAMEYNLKDNVLMSCSAHPPNAGMEEKTPEGLLLKHEYALLDVFEFANNQLVMLKNPHGKGSEEWTGDWSDNSAKWGPYPNEKKKYVKEGQENDGMFCMDFKDWRSRYTHLNMVRLFENSGWNEQNFQGLITPESSGLTNNKAKTKYCFALDRPTRMVLSISQPDNKRFDNTEFYSMGIGLRVIMSLKVGSGIIEEPAYDRDNNLVVAEVPPVYARQVSIEIFLDAITKEYEQWFGAGKYFIVPLVAEKDVFMPYVLNVFTYGCKPTINEMKPVYPPVEPADSDYKGDWRPHWFYEVLPEFEEGDDEDDEDVDGASKGRSEIARAKGRQEIARAKGRQEVARAKGRYELARAKGRSEVARAKGRAEVARAKGRAEVLRAKGRAEIGRAKSRNTEYRQEGKANVLKKDGGAPAPTGVAEIEDSIQDAMEAKVKQDYSL